LLIAQPTKAALVLVVALAGGVYLYLYDPSVAGRYPSCPVRWVTGLQCPGCGTLRALHGLMHGDLGRALELNPLAVLMAPLLAWYLAAAGYRLAGDRRLPGLAVSLWFSRAILAIVVGFTVVRNAWPGVWGVPI
jgi:hypothetical protein